MQVELLNTRRWRTGRTRKRDLRVPRGLRQPPPKPLEPRPMGALRERPVTPPAMDHGHRGQEQGGSTPLAKCKIDPGRLKRGSSRLPTYDRFPAVDVTKRPPVSGQRSRGVRCLTSPRERDRSPAAVIAAFQLPKTFRTVQWDGWAGPADHQSRADGARRFSSCQQSSATTILSRPIRRAGRPPWHPRSHQRTNRIAMSATQAGFPPVSMLTVTRITAWAPVGMVSNAVSSACPRTRLPAGTGAGKRTRSRP